MRKITEDAMKAGGMKGDTVMVKMEEEEEKEEEQKAKKRNGGIGEK